MERNSCAVELENVSKSFANRSVLKGVTFQVSAGEAFCLLGRSGIGKSVTLKLIMGLLRADHGRVLVEGQDIASLDPPGLAELRKHVGFLFQEGALFDSITVGENVAFPLRRHTHKREPEIQQIVREKLKHVELVGQEKKMPSELSGGMRKRAGLARALSLDPRILLIDEPSSGLDRITAAEIQDLFLRLKEKRNVTLVVVTHDITGARKFADRFAVLEGGIITACGTADELAASDDRLVRQLAAGAETSCPKESS